MTQLGQRQTRLEFLLLEARRMPVDRLVAAIKSIADDDSDAAARTRAALDAALDTQRERERNDGT